MTKRLLRYAAGILAGGVLAVLPATPAVAAVSTPAKPIPEIATTSAPAALVPYGSSVTVGFTVTADDVPLKRRLVQLCTGTTSANLKCTKAYTSATGVVTLKKPKLTTPLYVKVAAPADATTGPATSELVTVRPQVGVTVTRKGQTATVTLSAAAKQWLLVERQVGSEWEFTGTVVQAKTAKITIPYLWSWENYRVIVSDTPGVAGTISGTV